MTDSTQGRTRWLLRALLAAALLLGSEIFFWNDPLGRPLPEWLPLAGGYLLLATLLLDAVVRFRVRDLWGAMLVLGGYGLLNGLLLNPQTALRTVPNTILSHALGAHWLIGLEMFGLFLMLIGGRPPRRLLVLGAIGLGFNWGVWVRWFPVFNPGAFAPVPLPTMLLTGAAGLLPVLGLWWLVRPWLGQVDVTGLRLSARGYALALLAAALLFFWQALRGAYADAVGVAVTALVLGFCWLLLWFRADTRKPPLLVHYLTHGPLPPAWAALTVAVAAALASLGYTLPLIALPLNQFTLLTLVFAGIGTVWIPLVAIVLGVTGVERQMQIGELS